MAFTNQQFIDRANKTHGGKYDYSKCHFDTIRSHITIICPEHGEFIQTATNHIHRKSGCPKCAIEKRASICTLTNEQFIERANKIHNNKYQYPQQYSIASEKIEIICPVHGSFVQTAANHIHRKSGCPKCAHEKNKLNIKTTQQFIKQANEIHDNKYDYSDVNYCHSTTKVKIICPVHGPFWQRPNDHLTGYGCKQCGASIGGVYSQQFFDLRPEYKNIPGWFYIIRLSIDNNNYIKVGITRNDVKTRYPGIRDQDILLTAQYPLYDAFIIEQNILQHFSQFKLTNQPISPFSGWTECLDIDPSQFLDILLS